MRRVTILTLIAGFIVAIAVIAWFATSVDDVDVARMLLPDTSDIEFYPAAPPMPPVVTTPMSTLLSEYESFLMKEAPHVIASLQPALTVDEITEFESKYDIALSPDLRELYQWRNGTPANVTANAFPYLWFVPLDTALRGRSAKHRQLEQLDPRLREIQDEWISHTYPWIGVILDPAGDGYYFDPERQESEGSFFHFSATGPYVFYPSVRNYIAEVVEQLRTEQLYSEESGIASRILSYQEEEAIINRFGTRKW